MTLQIEFISSNSLKPMDEEERMDYILRSVSKNKIIVLDEMLSPVEEKNLIQETMKRIDSKFSGIEISTLGKNESDVRTKIIKMLGGNIGGMTVIGPSKLVKQIKRNPNKINLFAESR
ncbi:MAG: DUF2073 domain-containing protein [Candidatus Micrarchaeota archaeon]